MRFSDNQISYAPIASQHGRHPELASAWEPSRCEHTLELATTIAVLRELPQIKRSAYRMESRLIDPKAQIAPSPTCLGRGPSSLRLDEGNR